MEEYNENITIIIEEPVQEQLIDLVPEPVQEPYIYPQRFKMVRSCGALFEFVTDNLVKESNGVPFEFFNGVNLVPEPAVYPNALPKIIFIVPYRDREQQKEFFMNHMKNILIDIPQSHYKIFFSHQMDSRDFNRGAVKNIGFLAIKEKYPNDYKNMTFVFNDIDTMPYTKNFFNYETSNGVVKHFYGYEFALGGIVSIKGSDFEKISGFPNLWTWGYEDNLLQKRVLAANLVIDRSQFYPLMDKNVFQMKDGLFRIVNRTEYDRVINNTEEGIHSISNLKYTIEKIDDIYSYINIVKFSTENVQDVKENKVHDLRSGLIPFTKNNNNKIVFKQNTNRRGAMRMFHI
jgi:hypothetical protein